MAKSLTDSFSISTKIHKDHLTPRLKGQIIEILNETFRNGAQRDPEAKFSLAGDFETLSLYVDAHFIATARMVMYAVLKSYGVNPPWNYQID